MSGPDALPPIADAALPRAVRAGTAAEKRAYKAALGFERVLVDQLLKTAKLGGEAVAEGPHAGTIRDGLADALAAGGGLGLAGQLHAATRPREEAA